MVSKTVEICEKKIGPEEPCYLIGEIGINHNGDINLAKKLIDLSVEAGLDAVKFQKRTPELCVPESQRDKMRETPWGYISYMDYRYKVEFEKKEFDEIDRYCRECGIQWFASAWDIPSIEFLEQYDPIAVKIPSALITNSPLVKAANETGRIVFLSSGMSTMQEVEKAVSLVDNDHLLLAHSTSTYPCPIEELNLKMIYTLSDHFNCSIGYSGHEVGLQTTVAAVAMGAQFIERHITLDRAMWGSDHSASIEPIGLSRLVTAIRAVEISLGDGIKQVYESERDSINRLRVSA